MNTKEIEQLGLQALRIYFEREYGVERFTIEDIRNSKNLGCDLRIILDGKELFIELKASKNKSLPTNIRFTHQTIATMYKANIIGQMIVAFVYNLSEGIDSAKFKFFRFGDFQPTQIFVEPHFIIQPKQTIKNAEKLKIPTPIKETLNELLDSEESNYNIGELFESKVSTHMKLK